jgi:hypothetical protein
MQAYELILPLGIQRLYPTFYVSLLEPYYVQLGYNPGLVLMLLEEGEHNETDITLGDYYEIEKIVAYRRDREGTLF